MDNIKTTADMSSDELKQLNMTIEVSLPALVQAEQNLKEAKLHVKLARQRQKTWDKHLKALKGKTPYPCSCGHPWRKLIWRSMFDGDFSWCPKCKNWSHIGGSGYSEFCPH